MTPDGRRPSGRRYGGGCGWRGGSSRKTATTPCVPARTGFPDGRGRSAWLRLPDLDGRRPSFLSDVNAAASAKNLNFWRHTQDFWDNFPKRSSKFKVYPNEFS